MNWYFIDTGLNDGKFNMEFDLQLTKKINSNISILRLYQWQPYCISLGANQEFSVINISKAIADNIDVVKRPTGGRAILHSEELTYSVAFPINNDYSLREIYLQINLALKKGLELFNPILKNLDLKNEQVNLRDFYKSDLASACFAVSSKNEINFNGKKLVGSAQRKIGNLVLQHGSILCGTHHLKLINYLNLSPDEKKQFYSHLKNSTIDLQSILQQKINIEELAESIKQGFQKHFQIIFQQLNK